MASSSAAPATKPCEQGLARQGRPDPRGSPQPGLNHEILSARMSDSFVETDAVSLKEAIRDHYDRLSVFYRAFWGEHIHHGYWEDGQQLSAKEAQEQLVQLLARRASIPTGARVLDVGTGVGGSARWLACELGCTVDGITLSPVQAEMAVERARKEGLDDHTRFWVHDAHDLDALAAEYDAVWVIECSEHLADKSAFLASAARRLRPGGVLALCTWLRGDAPGADGERLLKAVQEGMLIPPLPTARQFAGWMREAGFDPVESEDLTRRVEATWDRCEALARRPEVKALLAVSDARVRRFVKAFPAMREAYRQDAMAYGLFVGWHP